MDDIAIAIWLVFITASYVSCLDPEYGRIKIGSWIRSVPSMDTHTLWEVLQFREDKLWKRGGICELSWNLCKVNRWRVVGVTISIESGFCLESVTSGPATSDFRNNAPASYIASHLRHAQLKEMRKVHLERPCSGAKSWQQEHARPLCSGPSFQLRVRPSRYWCVGVDYPTNVTGTPGDVSPNRQPYAANGRDISWIPSLTIDTLLTRQTSQQE